MLRFFKVEDRTLKRHISIEVFVVYIDTGSSMPISPSTSCDLTDENNKIFWNNLHQAYTQSKDCKAKYIPCSYSIIPV